MKRLVMMTVSFALVAATAAFAPVLAGPYVGASVGQATSDISLNDVGDGSTMSGSVDDNDTCWRVYGGWTMVKFFGVEAAWTDMGEVGINATSDGSGSTYGAGPVTSLSSVDGFSLSAVGKVPVGKGFDVFARAGYMFWDAESSVSNSGLPGGTISGSTSGEDLVYAAGATWDFMGPGALRFEYEQAKIGDVDTSAFSVGWTFLFN